MRALTCQEAARGTQRALELLVQEIGARDEVGARKGGGNPVLAGKVSAGRQRVSHAERVVDLLVIIDVDEARRRALLLQGARLVHGENCGGKVCNHV